MAAIIVAVVLVLFVLFVAAKTVRIIPQARAGVVERLGRYSRTLSPGLSIVVPFVDRVKPLIDLREQVVSFPPSGVITQDNVTVGIDTVLYFTITDPKSATYEVANPLQAIEQLTTTTLRNVIGGLTLEETLTSRDQINTQLRTVLDEATGRWGIRVNRVELKAIDPPASIQEAMEKQMRAERDRRASILNAEGVKQSAILTAEGEKQSAVLRAEGAKTSAILRAEGEASAIDTVFRAIHAGEPDQALLSYKYLEMLPELARGEANKIFVIPSEFSQALGSIGGALGGLTGAGTAAADPRAAAGAHGTGDAKQAGPDATGGSPAASASPRELTAGPPVVPGDPLRPAPSPAEAPVSAATPATPAPPNGAAHPAAGGSVAQTPADESGR